MFSLTKRLWNNFIKNGNFSEKSKNVHRDKEKENAVL